MLRVLVALLLLTTALAGCSGDPAVVPLDAVDQGTPGTRPPGPAVETEQPPAPVGEPVMTVSGVVNDEEARPVPGATVQLVSLNRTRITDGAGAFVFENVPVGFQVLRADATDFLAAEVTAKPVEAGATATVVLVLQRFAEQPYHQTVQFQGIIQCALEVLIITPSCDTLVEFIPGAPSVTQDESEFDLTVEPNWRNVVLDLDFDPPAQPGFEGMRITVKALNDADNLGTYEDYGQFTGSDDINARLEPGTTLEEGKPPLPANSTSFRFATFAQGHGWHAVCVPFCTLGVGVGLDVEFELFATAFYVEAAPEGWSILA